MQEFISWWVQVPWTRVSHRNSCHMVKTTQWQRSHGIHLYWIYPRQTMASSMDLIKFKPYIIWSLIRTIYIIIVYFSHEVHLLIVFLWCLWLNTFSLDGNTNNIIYCYFKSCEYFWANTSKWCNFCHFNITCQ